MVYEVFNAVDEKMFTSSVFFDLSKAFDCVNHKLLLTKLHHLGIRGIANNLLESYLTGRQQAVQIKSLFNQTWTHSISKLTNIKNGVPQGSVLGPLLFLIYINDLPQVINEGHLTIYADDCTITFKSSTLKELQNIMNVNLENVNNWFCTNYLKLNIDKSQLMSFSNSKRSGINSNTLTNDLQLPNVNSTKFLGINFDCNLRWNSQIDAVCNHLVKLNYAFRRLNTTLNQNTLLTMYHGLVETKLRYGITIWGNGNHGQFLRIFRLQKSILRSIFHKSRKESCRDIFMQYGILTFYSLKVFESCMFLKNNSNIFQINSDFPNKQ